MFSSNDTAIQYWNQLSSIYYTQHWIYKDTTHRILTLKEFMVFSERWKHHQLEKIVYTRIPGVRRRAGQTVTATSFQRGQSGRINCPFPLVSVCPQLGRACNRKVSCGRSWGWVPQYDVDKEKNRVIQALLLWSLLYLRNITKLMKSQIYLDLYWKS